MGRTSDLLKGFIFIFINIDNIISSDFWLFCPLVEGGGRLFSQKFNI